MIAVVTLSLGGYFATVGGVAVAAFVAGYELHRVREQERREEAQRKSRKPHH